MTFILFVFFLFLLLIGIPVGFSLAIAGGAGIWFVVGIEKLVGTLPNILYSSLNSFTLVAIPLYVLMGNIMIRGKLSDEIFDALNEFIGHLPGGLAIVTCLFCTIFAAISGSSVATFGDRGDAGFACDDEIRISAEIHLRIDGSGRYAGYPDTAKPEFYSLRGSHR